MNKPGNVNLALPVRGAPSSRDARCFCADAYAD
jgi:hypothetical protein